MAFTVAFLISIILDLECEKEQDAKHFLYLDANVHARLIRHCP